MGGNKQRTLAGRRNSGATKQRIDQKALDELDTVGRKMGVFFTVYVNGDV
jgi:hypothetical protein